MLEDYKRSRVETTDNSSNWFMEIPDDLDFEDLL